MAYTTQANSAGKSRAMIVALVLLAAVVLRGAFFLRFDESYFDSDQAIVGLMAKHLARGPRFPALLLRPGIHARRGVVGHGAGLRGLRPNRVRAPPDDGAAECGDRAGPVVAAGAATPGCSRGWRRWRRPRSPSRRSSPRRTWSRPRAVTSSRSCGCSWRGCCATSRWPWEPRWRRRSSTASSRPMPCRRCSWCSWPKPAAGSRRLIRPWALTAFAFVAVFQGVSALKPHADLLGPGSAGVAVSVGLVGSGQRRAAAGPRGCEGRARCRRDSRRWRRNTCR